MTTTAPVAEGPIFAPIVRTVPGADATATITAYRYAGRFVYNIEIQRAGRFSFAWGRDSMPEALAVVESAIAWELRLHGHRAAGHAEPIVAHCAECDAPEVEPAEVEPAEVEPAEVEPAGALIVRYADGDVIAYDLDAQRDLDRLRRMFEDAAHGQDVAPIVDVWHFGPAGDPARVRTLHDVDPFDGDDYADARVRFVVETPDQTAPGGIRVTTVATVAYRVDGRS